jgi:hypothetical protein
LILFVYWLLVVWGMRRRSARQVSFLNECVLVLPATAKRKVEIGPQGQLSPTARRFRLWTVFIKGGSAGFDGWLGGRSSRFGRFRHFADGGQ